MGKPGITRRRFNGFLAAGLALGFGRRGIAAPGDPERDGPRLRAAAIQMTPALGDVQANLGQAEQLVREALARGAEWVVLPEMFTSAAAFHPRMLDAVQPLDGAPYRLLVDLARRSGVVIGGSYLARRDGQVYNTFVLAMPDGSTSRHDKDLPTYWENCYYTGAARDDRGILQSPIGPVGAALCWELIRTRTARRLLGKVRLVAAASCWWTLPDDAGDDNPLRAVNLQMLQHAPVRFAHLLGVPVIHGSHAGRFSGFYSPDLPDVAYESAFLGEAMIVDSGGRVLGRRSLADGAGVVIADIAVSDVPNPVQKIPPRFWIPEDMPKAWQESWQRWLPRGARYYETVTLPYLETGVVNEYEPEWMSRRPLDTPHPSDLIPGASRSV